MASRTFCNPVRHGFHSSILSILMASLFLFGHPNSFDRRQINITGYFLHIHNRPCPRKRIFAVSLGKGPVLSSGYTEGPDFPAPLPVPWYSRLFHRQAQCSPGTLYILSSPDGRKDAWNSVDTPRKSQLYPFSLCMFHFSDELQ